MNAIPADYQPYLTAEFLGVLVLVLVGPVRRWLDPHWLPIVAIAVSLTLQVGIALRVGADPVLMALAAIHVALVASGIYGWSKAAAAVFKRSDGLPPRG